MEEIAEGFDEATRKSGGKVLTSFQKVCPNLLGGSADLTKSTNAKGLDGDFTKENPLGRNICYGVREHAMGAIANGITLFGGLRTFTGAFFVFSDYLKPAIRMAALMKVPTIFIFTHDSIMVGEDGPTHEPIEQLIGLRSIPNCNVIRPADARETYEAFKIAYNSEETPTVIVLSRQNLVVTNTNSELVNLGAYIVKDCENPKHILLATGSEVSLACEVSKLIEGVRVVSMPSEFLFEKQEEAYKNTILPDRNKTIAIEMGATAGWYKYASKVIGIDTFGASAPAKVVAKHFGFTAEDIANKILNK
jgi:transketolase